MLVSEEGWGRLGCTYSLIQFMLVNIRGAGEDYGIAYSVCQFMKRKRLDSTDCGRCWGRGWYPVWVDDPDDEYWGGYEDGEAYCDCSYGTALNERETKYEKIPVPSVLVKN